MSNKNYFEDIKPAKHQARDEAVESLYTKPAKTRAHEMEPKVTKYTSTKNYEPEKHSRKGIWSVAIISVIVLVVAIAYMLGGATVTIDPTKQELALENTFKASKDGTDSALPFQLMILSDEGSTKVTSNGMKEVSLSAKGKAILYNNFSSAPQHLNTDTRIETSSGKIYKIVGAVDIPGTTTKDGKTVPGELSVSIYASAPGEEYNLDKPTEFKIFGFKGTPKYTKFYAKSVGAITGGFKGQKAAADETAMAEANKTLEKNITDSLVSKALAQIPTGFVIFDGSTFVDFDDAVEVPIEGSGEVEIKRGATFYGFIFDQERLEQEIAKQKISGFDGAKITTKGLKDLTFDLQNKESLNPKEAKEINFTLTGPLTVIWSVDQMAVTDALIGQKKKEFLNIMAKFPTIDKAEVRISPPWNSKLPDSADDIDIVVRE